MDILSALPEDIFNEIIPYLTAKDILKASLVSKGWYQLFGQSRQCMQKVTVKFTCHNCNNDINPVLNSDRKYQNLKIGFEHRMFQELGVEPKIRSILKKFANSIVKLKTSHDFQRICELPKLKELQYENEHWRSNKKFSNYFCSNGLMTKCPKINKLAIICQNLDDKYFKMLQKAIKDMEYLKELTIKEFTFLKNIKLEDCKFQLESFENQSFSSLREIYDFLKYHRSTMKAIKVTVLFLTDVTFLLSEFPQLNTLDIHYLDEDLKENSEFEIPENFTVKNLIIGHLHQDLGLRYDKILAKLKNLQQVSLLRLNHQLIPELIACQSLNLVKYRKLDDDVTDDQKIYMHNNEKIKFIYVPYEH